MDATDLPEKGHFQKQHRTYAVRITDDNLDEIRSYEDCTLTRLGSQTETPGAVRVEVQTHEGTLQAEPGDWIATDSQGRHYPIEHEEFTRIYEPAE